MPYVGASKDAIAISDVMIEIIVGGENNYDLLLSDRTTMRQIQANPFPEGCPPADVEDDGVDAPDDPTLYDTPLPGKMLGKHNDLSDGSLAPPTEI